MTSAEPFDAERLAGLRAKQRQVLQQVPIWAFTTAEPVRGAPGSPDARKELVHRDDVARLLQDGATQAVLTELASHADVVITPDLRERLERLVHAAALADLNAGDGYVDPRVEAWQRPKGAQ